MVACVIVWWFVIVGLIIQCGGNVSHMVSSSEWESFQEIFVTFNTFNLKYTNTFYVKSYLPSYKITITETFLYCGRKDVVCRYIVPNTDKFFSSSISHFKYIFLLEVTIAINYPS